jgi:uncharacterized membrane protein
MSDPLALDRSPAPPAATHDDKILPTAIYVLYLVGLFNGLTILIGLVMAYVLKEGAGERALSHYVFQIRTVWVGLAWAIIASLLFLVGFPLTFIGIGFLIWGLAWTILALLGVWFAVRCAMGLAFILRDQAYPRPRTWLF